MGHKATQVVKVKFRYLQTETLYTMLLVGPPRSEPECLELVNLPSTYVIQWAPHLLTISPLLSLNTSLTYKRLENNNETAIYKVMIYAGNNYHNKQIFSNRNPPAAEASEQVYEATEVVLH